MQYKSNQTAYIIRVENIQSRPIRLIMQNLNLTSPGVVRMWIVRAVQTWLDRGAVRMWIDQAVQTWLDRAVQTWLDRGGGGAGGQGVQGAVRTWKWLARRAITRPSRPWFGRAGHWKLARVRADGGGATVTGRVPGRVVMGGGPAGGGPVGGGPGVGGPGAGGPGWWRGGWPATETPVETGNHDSTTLQNTDLLSRRITY